MKKLIWLMSMLFLACNAYAMNNGNNDNKIDAERGINLGTNPTNTNLAHNKFSINNNPFNSSTESLEEFHGGNNNKSLHSNPLLPKGTIKKGCFSKIRLPKFNKKEEEQEELFFATVKEEKEPSCWATVAKTACDSCTKITIGTLLALGIGFGLSRMDINFAVNVGGITPSFSFPNASLLHELFVSNNTLMTRFFPVENIDVALDKGAVAFNFTFNNQVWKTVGAFKAALGL